MKTLVSIFVILVGTAGFFLTRANEDDHRSCTCSGTFCSCDATCLDQGEIPSCTCGTFSCVCKCNPKDANNAHPSLPTMNADQQGNSQKGEKYFRELGSPQGSTIANAIRNMRDAVLGSDISKYTLNATLAENTYQQLSPAQRAAYESWSAANLKK